MAPERLGHTHPPRRAPERYIRSNSSIEVLTPRRHNERTLSLIQKSRPDKSTPALPVPGKRRTHRSTRLWSGVRSIGRHRRDGPTALRLRRFNPVRETVRSPRSFRSRPPGRKAQVAWSQTRNTLVDPVTTPAGQTECVAMAAALHRVHPTPTEMDRGARDCAARVTARPQAWRPARLIRRGVSRARPGMRRVRPCGTVW